MKILLPALFAGGMTTAWSIIDPVGRICYRYLGPQKHLVLQEFRATNKSLDNLKDYKAVEVMICLKGP
ncbi:MAG: hypothetical protein E2P05_04380 [Acidobacteria bacterium]|nr:MAG: hypothetical protein E2P05_04380 [Acidobacteriota bacterium]